MSESETLAVQRARRLAEVRGLRELAAREAARWQEILRDAMRLEVKLEQEDREAERPAPPLAAQPAPGLGPRGSGASGY